MFGTLGIQEILMIFIIGIIVFGVIRMPKIVKFLGSGLKKYRTVRDTLKNPFNFDTFMDQEPEESKQGQQQYYNPNASSQGPQWEAGRKDQQSGGYSDPDQQDKWQGDMGRGNQPKDKSPPGGPDQSENQRPFKGDSENA